MRAGFVDSLFKRCPGATFTNTHDIAGAGTPRAEGRVSIAEKAASLAAATVNSEEECHVKDFNRRVCRESAYIAEKSF